MPAAALQVAKTQTGAVLNERRSSRYLFIDGLRGIAAVLVLLHHLLHGTMLEIPLAKVLPLPFRVICNNGAFGVEIFFVISGFVIAHSLRTLATGKDLTKFIIRRQLRLDPPYWCALVLYLAAIYAEQLVPGLVPARTPTPSAILSNACYLQGILRMPGIVGGSWTLCLEIQFYLLTAVILLSAELLRKRTNAHVQELMIDWAVASLAVVSLVRSLADCHSPWFIEYWIYFASGMLCYRSFRDGKPKPSFLLVGGLLACSAAYSLKPAMIFAAVTVVLIYVACRIGTIDRWLSQPIFQYLGKISYSLYLLNLLVAWNVLRLGFKITGYNEPASLGWFILGGIGSIAAAHLFYTFVEKPSVTLGQKVKAGW